MLAVEACDDEVVVGLSGSTDEEGEEEADELFPDELELDAGEGFVGLDGAAEDDDELFTVLLELDA